MAYLLKDWDPFNARTDGFSVCSEDRYQINLKGEREKRVLKAGARVKDGTMLILW